MFQAPFPFARSSGAIAAALLIVCGPVAAQVAPARPAAPPAASGVAPASGPSSVAKLVDKEGAVTVVRGEAKTTDPQVPFGLQSGDKVETAASSEGTLVFTDGAKVLVRPSSSFEIGAEPKSLTLKLMSGRLKCWIHGSLKRKFAIKTLTAVVAVRGTEFDVEQTGDELLVEVYDGLVGVLDPTGREVLVGSGERLRVQPGRPMERPERLEGRVLGDPKDEIRREVGLSMSRDQLQAAVAVEQRLAEYQEGKTMIDVSGDRVRLEEYIMRPASNQFKLVVLNERDARTDYFYYQGTFNKDLPADLSTALKDLNGKTGATPPEFYLTSAESARSNTEDSIVENFAGGHLVQSTLGADKVVYHPDTDSFETVVSGTQLWENLFDNYAYKVNGTEWYGWEPLSGSGITAYDYSQWRTRVAGSTLGTSGATITCTSELDCTTKENTLRASTITEPDGPDSLHDRVTVAYKASLAGPVLYTETYDFYVADDAGTIATSADFTGVLSGASYLQTLLKFNHEQVIETSSFEGRKIDLVVEPKILIRSGLLE